MKRSDVQLLFAIWQGFGLMIVAALVLMIIFRWGETLPFLIQLFTIDNQSLLFVIGIGVVSGLVMALVVTGVLVLTGTELPDNEMTRILERIIRMPGGLVTVGLGAGFAEEFLFRGALVGLFLDTFPAWLVLLLNALLFMALHIPQYRGEPFMHLTILVMGFWLAFLFYFTGSLLAPVIAHALYNTILGWHLRKTSANRHVQSE
ncbi:lysostaphin resistance A-like protein [Geomicrobium sp. JSM 1781026]